MPVQLGLAGDQLGFLRVHLADAAGEFLGRLLATVGLALQLVPACGELGLELLQLELALVELVRARLHELFAGGSHSRNLLLAACKCLELRGELCALVLDLAQLRGELLLRRTRTALHRRPLLDVPRTLAELLLEPVQLLLARVELLRACLHQLLSRRAHVRELLLAPLEVFALRDQLRLRLGQHALALRDLVLALLKFLLDPRDLGLALGKPLLDGLLFLFQLGTQGRGRCLGACELLLAVGNRPDLVRELGRAPRTLPVRRLQLAHFHLDELLALGDPRFAARQLLLERLEPVLGVGELVEPRGDFPFSLLERRLRRGQGRRAMVELGNALGGFVRELLGAQRVALAVERRTQLLLARERCRQLGTQSVDFDIARRRRGFDRLAG